MYQIGDEVLYGMHGVCGIKAVEERILDGKARLFLVLEPKGQTGSQYLVPTHSAAAMGKLRPILTAAELQQLLSSDEIRQNVWIADENQRKHTYRELIAGGDRALLLQMIYSLYQHQAKQAEQGKKFHLCDESFLRDAEKLACTEISAVLNMDADSARSYLRNQLKNT